MDDDFSRGGGAFCLHVQWFWQLVLRRKVLSFAFIATLLQTFPKPLSGLFHGLSLLSGRALCPELLSPQGRSAIPARPLYPIGRSFAAFHARRSSLHWPVSAALVEERLRKRVLAVHHQLSFSGRQWANVVCRCTILLQRHLRLLEND